MEFVSRPPGHRVPPVKAQSAQFDPAHPVVESMGVSHFMRQESGPLIAIEAAKQLFHSEGALGVSEPTASTLWRSARSAAKASTKFCREVALSSRSAFESTSPVWSTIIGDASSVSWAISSVPAGALNGQ